MQATAKSRVITAARVRLAFVPARVKKVIMVETLRRLRWFAIAFLLAKAPGGGFRFVRIW
jgi:hypothetical protein